MDTELTLNINQSVIKSAKEYAQHNNISLSKLIEDYLFTLTQKTNREIEITPLVKELSGVISLPSDFDEKGYVFSNEISDLHNGIKNR